MFLYLGGMAIEFAVLKWLEVGGTEDKEEDTAAGGLTVNTIVLIANAGVWLVAHVSLALRKLILSLPHCLQSTTTRCSHLHAAVWVWHKREHSRLRGAPGEVSNELWPSGRRCALYPSS